MNIELDQLWQRVLKDDEPAFERLYKLAFPVLVQYANSIVQQPELAEEVVQDVMLKLWRSRALIVIQGSIMSYLFRMTHNHALNALKQKKTLKQSVNQLGSEELWQFIADNYDFDEQILEHLYAVETSHLIEKSISDLPEQCQRVFRMSRLEEKKNDEIARELNVSENTVKTHLYRALQKISEILKLQ